MTPTPASRTRAPWWVLPAVFAAGLCGALLSRGMAPAAAPAVVAAAGGTAATPAAPIQGPAQADHLSLQGVVVLDGQPLLALLRDASTGTVRVARDGDALGPGLVVRGIETERVTLAHAGGTLALSMAPVPPPSAVPAPRVPPAAMPQAAGSPSGGAPASDIAALPPLPEGQNGNAAFRAAIEERLAALRR